MKEAKFEVIYEDSETSARIGIITIGDKQIETPFFMPVATYGFVKGIPFPLLWQIGYRCVIFNIFHLMTRPGISKIVEVGGLNKYVGWNGLITTDSGGFQIFSLGGSKKASSSSKANVIVYEKKESKESTQTPAFKIINDEVLFTSPIDGQKMIITPEIIMKSQIEIKSNFIMPLDICPAYNLDKTIVEKDLEQTKRWFARSFSYWEKHKNTDCMLFYIIQGGVFPDLRLSSIKYGLDFNPDGFAIGGLMTGEPPSDTYKITSLCVSNLPKDKIRYAMGVGTPLDLIKMIALGIDMFDCVIPTRNGRNGQILTLKEKIHITNSKFGNSTENFSEYLEKYLGWKVPTSAVNHAFKIGEMTGPILASLHNLIFYYDLINKIKNHIKNGTFGKFLKNVLS